MNEKENKTFFEDLPKELQKEFVDKFNHFCEALRTEGINDKDHIVIDEPTQLNESGKKLVKIYDILYDLYVDDTDCTKCQSFTYCMMHGTECLYHEDFELNDDDKDFLTKKAKEIYEIATK